MSQQPQSSLLHYLRCATGLWRSDPRPDAELLAAFAATRDEFAFAVLVGRYGQAVWRSCARVLGDTPEAEDVFQAAFMTLARKPPSLRRESLGGWLHTTAHRLALNARRATGRRNRLTADARSRPGRQPDPDLANDLQGVVAEELAVLPERLRVPLTLYYLEGQSQADVARVMNLSDRAVRDRLNRGLDALRKRLAERGLTVSAVVLATLLCPLPSARAVSARLLADTAAASARFAADPSATPGPAAALAARLLTPRFPVWSVVAIAALTGLAGAVVVVALPSNRPLPPSPPPVVPPPMVAQLVADPQPALVPAPQPAPRMVARTFCHDGAVTAVAVSPDGKRVASAGTDHVVRVWNSDTGREVAHFDAPPEGITALAFSPDGATLVADDPKTGLAVWDLKDGNRRQHLIGQAAGMEALAFSPDGRRLVTIGRDGKLLSMDLTREQGSRLDRETIFKERLMKFWTRLWAAPPADPPAAQTIRVGSDYAAAFTPDSRTLYAVSRQLDITRLNFDSGRTDKLALVGPRSDVVKPVRTVAFSPDARWMAWGNGDNKIGLANLIRLGKIQLIRGHDAKVIALAFTPDGGTLASADIEGHIGRWTLPAPKVRFEGILGKVPFRTVVLAFSPDGRRLYGGGEGGEVWCWNPKTLKAIGPKPEKQRDALSKMDKPEGAR